jgi:hypothetical protein
MGLVLWLVLINFSLKDKQFLKEMTYCYPDSWLPICMYLREILIIDIIFISFTAGRAVSSFQSERRISAHSTTFEVSNPPHDAVRPTVSKLNLSSSATACISFSACFMFVKLAVYVRDFTNASHSIKGNKSGTVKRLNISWLTYSRGFAFICRNSVYFKSVCLEQYKK